MSGWKWFRRRHTLSNYCRTNFPYIAALLVLLYVWSWVRSSHVQQTPTCTTMSEDTYQTDMHKFTNKIHKILDKLHIKHFLCYNALWGQLRYRRMLPWQREIEICIVREAGQTFQGFEEVFQDADIDIIYKGRRAEFLLNSEHLRGRVNLVVFALDAASGVYYRPGWMFRIMPSDTFPAYLIDGGPGAGGPLALKPFGGYQIPVPHHEVEIQKYHFPDTWWRPEDPVFC